MNSSYLIAFIVAILFALGAYFVIPELGNKGIATLVFASSLLSSLIAILRQGSSEPGEITTLYVGNLPYRANESMVKELFEQYGFVQSVRLMKDKQTGKRRGFGFVEISAKDADKAITSLNDTEFQQRTLKVREAKEKPEKA